MAFSGVWYLLVVIVIFDSLYLPVHCDKAGDNDGVVDTLELRQHQEMEHAVSDGEMRRENNVKSIGRKDKHQHIAHNDANTITNANTEEKFDEMRFEVEHKEYRSRFPTTDESDLDSDENSDRINGRGSDMAAGNLADENTIGGYPGESNFHSLNRGKRMAPNHNDEDSETEMEFSFEKETGKQYINSHAQLLKKIYERPSVQYQISPYDYDHDTQDAINIKFTPFKVLSVNEKEQSVSIASFVHVKWNDDALRWDPSRVNNITKINLKSETIWTPSIVIPKANGDGFLLRIPDYISVDTEKKDNVKLSTLFKFTTSCELDLSYFPFDTQTCSVLFRDENSRPLTGEDRDNNTDILGQLADIGGEWDIEQNGVQTLKQSEECSMSDAVEYTITMKRRSTFYVANLLIPLHMTSFVALFVFWIPPETGEKISFMVSIYVSTAMYLSFINDVLPHSLTRLPSFNIITVCINVQIALTFIASLLVLRRFRYQTDPNNLSTTTSPPPQSPRPSTMSSPSTSSLPSYSNIDKVTTPPSTISPTQSSDKAHVNNNKSKIKKNSVAAIDYLDQPWAWSPCHDLDPPTQPKSPSDVSWLDYRFLDKMFFVIFTIIFVFILTVPWIITA